jgi:predicted tellurium resistance membrane protein TerC
MHSLNGFQTISIIGLAFSLFCQGALILVGKTVTDMWALYPTWAAVFLFGTIVKLLIKEEEHHH